MNAGGRKKALVVDDSAFMRKLISDFLSSHPKIEVIGTARNGQDAVEKVIALKPDVVTMDIEMPVMDGLKALQEIMAKHPVPVVMLSSTIEKDGENTMLAMEYGAVDFVAKPGGSISLNLHEIRDEIVEKVISASEVQLSTLMRKYSYLHGAKPTVSKTIPTSTRLQRNPSILSDLRHRRMTGTKVSETDKTIVLIGTSTGGPRALQEVLTQLPESIGVPILIVQHMPPGFTRSLADRLDSLCSIKVKEAEDGELLHNGTAYIAPGGKHLKLVKQGLSYYAQLDDFEAPRMGHRPSVDVLLESAASHADVNYVTVIMTGMGNDGTKGMEILRRNARTVTIAESAKTSIVYGMPKAIEEAGLADRIVDLHNISDSIMEIIKA